MKIFLNTLIFIAGLLMIYFISTAAIPEDKRVIWLRTNAVKLNSIEPSAEDYSDLEPLKKIIGDSVKVVMLGEQSHGDGTTFLAKSRLIKFLHEKMGFDILAFESNMLDCKIAQENIENGALPSDEMPKAIFNIWTGVNEVQELMCYLDEKAKSTNPLEIAGFDNQFIASYNSPRIKPELEKFLDKLYINSIIDFEFSTLKTLKGILFENKRDDFMSNMEVYDDEIANILKFRNSAAAEKLFDKKTSFLFQLLETYYADRKKKYIQGDSPIKLDSVFSSRDVQMGKNLLWLSENNPGKKIIVWAATFHILRNIKSVKAFEITAADYEQLTTMGDIVYNKLKERSYSIGFTAYWGEFFGFIQQKNFEVPFPAKGSLEYLFNEAGLENAIIDLRNTNTPESSWLKEKIIARPMGYSGTYADWSKVLDGIIYTRRMYPSTKNTILR